MSLYKAAVSQPAKMLANLEAWLDASVAYAETKSFDPSVLLVARLAPDQYALVRQIQAACDQAKSGAARLAGREPPKHPDDEQTFDEVRARIKKVLDYLATFSPDDLEDAETRLVSLPFLGDKAMLGEDYLDELVLPNFYFHLVNAYAILRHNGVALGKRPFIGALSLRDA